MARSVPALQRVHRSFDLCRTSEEQKTMFVSRFSRAEHVDTLVSWIEAQNQCLQKFALLSSQDPTSHFDVPGDEASLCTRILAVSVCSKNLLRSDFSRCASEEEVLSVWKACSSCIRCFEDCDSVFRMLLLTVLPKNGLIRSALKLRMTKTLAPRLAVVDKCLSCPRLSASLFFAFFAETPKAISRASSSCVL